MSSLNYREDFIKALECELCKIYPDFSLKSSAIDPLTQALEAVRIVANHLVNERQLVEIEYEKINIKSPVYSATEVNDLLQVKDQLQKAQEKLIAYEKVLMEKEQQNASREAELKCFLQAFNEEKRAFDTEKQKFSLKLSDFETRKSQMLQQESKLIRDTEDLRIKKSKFAKESADFLDRNSKINEKSLEIEKLYEVSLSQNKFLSEELHALQTDSEKLSDKWKEVSQKELSLKKFESSLELEKIRLVNEAKHIESARFQLESDRNSSYLECRPPRIKPSQEPERLPLSPTFSSDSFTEPTDFGILLQKLHSQIAIYNEELSIRELSLSKSQRQLHKDQERLTSAFFSLSEIENSLERSKSEIQLFYQSVVPELEALLETNQKLLEDLKIQYSKVELVYLKMIESVFTLARVKDPEIRGSDVLIKFEARGKEAVMDSRALDYRLRELLVRMRVVEQRERDVERREKEAKRALGGLEKQREEIIEGKKNVVAEGERVKNAAGQLEAGVAALEEKERELRFVRVELEKRNKLLRAKEQMLESRALQVREIKPNEKFI